MKINLFFKQYKLGCITFKDGHLVYSSNCTEEKEFKENCFSSIFYPYFDSDNMKIQGLMPRFLKDYIKMCDNEFMISQAKIKKEDNLFTRLYKLSALNFDDFGFYLKAN